MKILVPTDFSPNADHAARFAVQISRHTSSQLILLNVISPQVPKNNPAYHLEKQMVDEVLQENNARFTQFINENCKNDDFSCKTKTREGHVIDEILDETRTIQADLIVMGTHGATGLKKIFFGSNTGKVIEKSHCPVLTIPEQAKINIPKKIAFATDYQETDLKSLNQLCKLAFRFEAEVILIHIAKKSDSSEDRFLEEFSKEVKKETGYAKIYYYVIKHEDVIQGIETYVSTYGIDLIAMSARKHNLFEKIFNESLSQKMAHQNHTPLLVFPTSDR